MSAPHLTPLDLPRAAEYASEARAAGTLTFTDDAQRRIVLTLAGPAMPSGGYWSAAYTDARSGRTVTAYVGAHRATPAIGLPPAISPEGLTLASTSLPARSPGRVEPVLRVSVARIVSLSVARQAHHFTHSVARQALTTPRPRWPTPLTPAPSERAATSTQKATPAKGSRAGPTRSGIALTGCARPTVAARAGSRRRSATTAPRARSASARRTRIRTGPAGACAAGLTRRSTWTRRPPATARPARSAARAGSSRRGRAPVAACST